MNMFLSAENGCLPLLNLYPNNLINSSPGNIIRMNIFSTDSDKLLLAIWIIIKDIINPNKLLPLSPKKFWNLYLRLKIKLMIKININKKACSLE